MNEENDSCHKPVGDSQGNVTQLQREMDSHRHACSLVEDTALSLFRAKLYEAESAAACAGAAAGLNRVEAEAHASVLLAEYVAGMEKISLQPKKVSI